MKVQRGGALEEILWRFPRHGRHGFPSAVETKDNRSPPDHGCMRDVPSSFNFEIMHHKTYSVKGLSVQFSSISGRNFPSLNVTKFPQRFFANAVVVSAWRRVLSIGGKILKGKKGHVHFITGHEGPERENRHKSTLSLTSVLDGW